MKLLELYAYIDDRRMKQRTFTGLAMNFSPIITDRNGFRVVGVRSSAFPYSGHAKILIDL